MANIVKVMGRIIRGNRFDENFDTEYQVFFINLAEISYFEFKDGEPEKTVEGSEPSYIRGEDGIVDRVDEEVTYLFRATPPSGRINLQSKLRILVIGDDAVKIFNALEEYSA